MKKMISFGFAALLALVGSAEEIESSKITSDIENDYGQNPYGTVCEMSAFRAKAATLKWCSLGTSITWYNDEPRPEKGLTHGYQDRTIEKLGLNKAANFLNRGVSGARIGDNGTEPPSGSPCDIYTLEWGINDWMRGTRVGNLEIFRRRLANPNDTCEDITTEVWYTFAASYARVITQIRAINPDAIIILMTPRKAFNNNNNLNNSMPAHWWDQSRPDSAQQEATYLYDYVKLIRAIGEEIHCPVVDQFRYAANVENLELLSIDKALHPNDAGYEVMANLLAPVMSKAIVEKYGIERCTHEGTTSVVPGTAATCTEAGTTDKTVCTNPDCQMVLTPSEIVPALGHDWGAWTVTTPATEGATGLKRRDCSRCDAYEELVVPRVGEIVALRNIAVVTKVGELPVLPAQVAGLRADGTVAGQCDVVWAEHVAPSAIGRTTITGTATVDNEAMPVTASVRATIEQSDDDIRNIVFGVPPTTAYPMSGITYPYASLNATAYANQVNGLYENNSFVWGGALGAAKDGDYNGKYAKEVFVFEFTLAKTSTVKGFTVWHMTDSGWLENPYPVFVEVSTDNGVTWTSVAVTGGARPKTVTSVPTASGSASVFKYDYELESPAASVTNLRLKFSPYGIETPEPGDSTNWKGLKISEIEVFGIEGESGGPTDPLTTDTLSALEVDNVAVTGFAPTTLSYTIEEAKAITSATQVDNMGITILPRANGAAHVVTLSESGLTKTYTVNMPTACEHATTCLEGVIPATCTTAGYTGDTVCEICEETIAKGSATSALGHDWGEWTVKTPATKTEAGLKERACQREGCTETEEQAIPAIADVVALRNVAVVTQVGTAPVLPPTVAGLVKNGATAGDFEVSWDSVDAPDAPGVTTVNGTAQVGDEVMAVAASVRAVAVGGGAVNVSPNATPGTSDTSCKNLSLLVSPNLPDQTWVTSNRRNGDFWDSLTWSSAQLISYVEVYYQPGHAIDAVVFETETGAAIDCLAGETQQFTDYQLVRYAFKTPISVTTLKCTFTGPSGKYVTVNRIWAYEEHGGGPTEPQAIDTLSALEVDNVAVTGFAPTTLAYTVDNGAAITKAAPSFNMGVTILDKADGEAHVVTFAEDGVATKNYKVLMPYVCLHPSTTVTGAKEATCTEPGSTGTEKCDTCDAVVREAEEIPATGHQHTTVTGASDPTCTEPGSTGTETCDKCHAVIREAEVIPALGHLWGEWVVTKNPTTDETGLKERDCSRCDAHEEQVIPVLAALAALRNVAVVTEVNKDLATLLPAKVNGLKSDGTLADGEFDVTWRDTSARTVPGVTQVIGDVTVDDKAMTVTASVRAVPAAGSELVNIAQRASSLTVDVDNADEINGKRNYSFDIVTEAVNLTNNWGGTTMVPGGWNTPASKFQCYWHNSQGSKITVDFAWETTQQIKEIFIAELNGNNHTGDRVLKDGSTGAEIPSSSYVRLNDHNDGSYTYYRINQGDGFLYIFNQPLALSALTIEFTAPSGSIANGIYGIEIWAEDSSPIVPSSADTLSALEVDGKAVKNFTPENLEYSVLGGEAITAATATENMGITVLPKYDGSAYAVTLAEDGESTETYTVAMPPCPHTHTHLDGECEPDCTTPGYTGDTVCDDCGKTVQEGSVIPALGHSWGDWEITKEPTYYEKGSRKHTCQREGCGVVESEDIAPIHRDPVGWIDVDFKNYTDGSTIANGQVDAVDGGTWAKPSADDTATVAHGDPDLAALVVTNEYLCYAAKAKSEANRDATVYFKAKFQKPTTDALPAEYNLGQTSVFVFPKGKTGCYKAYTADGWVELTGATPDFENFVDIKIDFLYNDETRGRLAKVTIDDAECTPVDATSPWFTPTGSAKQVTGVDFFGEFSLGHFYGEYLTVPAKSGLMIIFN